MGLLCSAAGTVNSVTGPGIRPAESDDLARLVELNNAAVPAVNHLTLDEMAWFLQVAHLVLVAEVPKDGTVAAFLVGLDGPECSYGSLNYEYFCDRYDRFLYVDRVVVDPVAWGRGLGQGFYRAFVASAAGHTHLCAEVNTVPRNERSLDFHQRFGFKAIGERSDGGTGKTVRMFALEI
jgi:predicted GNAT superfamily acetyltransferase